MNSIRKTNECGRHHCDESARDNTNTNAAYTHRRGSYPTYAHDVMRPLRVNPTGPQIPPAYPQTPHAPGPAQNNNLLARRRNIISCVRQPVSKKNNTRNETVNHSYTRICVRNKHHWVGQTFKNHMKQQQQLMKKQRRVLCTFEEPRVD